MTQKHLVQRQNNAAEQLAEAMKNLQIWPKKGKSYEKKQPTEHEELQGILDSKDSEVQKPKHPEEEVQKMLKPYKTSKKLRHFKPRGRGGYPMKMKVERDLETSKLLDQTTQTEGPYFKDYLVFEENRRFRANLIDPKLRHLPLYWGVPDRFFDVAFYDQPQPLIEGNWDYPKPEEQTVYFFNPPVVAPKTSRHQIDLRHIWLRDPRKRHPELVIDVNSARRYLDSKPSKNQSIGKTLHDFNEWRRAQDADDHQLHGWISSNLIKMDPHKFLARIDEDGWMRGKYAKQALRRMQNWMAMHSSWREEFLIYPVILFIREETK